MRFLFAPLEGITGYIYRNVYFSFFNQVDCYYSPFISTTQKHALRNKELRDVLPENNKGIKLIPQILGNHAGDFLYTAGQLQSLGYTEINLNLGCPSRTVVSKGKGSGFLAMPEALDRFLAEIFDKLELELSIKTRLGKEDPEEFEELLEIFQRYPVKELIIHPRVQRDFYRNTPNLEVFGRALQSSRIPVCYNGDIFTTEDYRRLTRQFPKLEAVMLGRGILKNPNLVAELRGEPPVSKEYLREFIDCLYERYREVLSGEVPVLFKMKEMWGFLAESFDGAEKYQKRILKCNSLKAYRQIERELFANCDLRSGGDGCNVHYNISENSF